MTTMCFCLLCSQCTPVLFSEISFCKAGSTFPETGCVSMPTCLARTLRYEWLTHRLPNKLKPTDKLEQSDSRTQSDKLIGQPDKLFDRRSVRMMAWFFLASVLKLWYRKRLSVWKCFPPRTHQLTEPLTLTSRGIFSLMLCVVPFTSFPEN